jgi:hypothetical protein
MSVMLQCHQLPWCMEGDVTSVIGPPLPTFADAQSRRLPGVLRTRCLSESHTPAQRLGGSFRSGNLAVSAFPERVSRLACAHASQSSRGAKQRVDSVTSRSSDSPSHPAARSAMAGSSD